MTAMQPLAIFMVTTAVSTSGMPDSSCRFGLTRQEPTAEISTASEPVT